MLTSSEPVHLCHFVMDGCGHWALGHCMGHWLTLPRRCGRGQLGGAPYAVNYTARAFTINGAPTLLLGGAIHPPRAAYGDWANLLAQMKVDGLNMVQIYVFWNFHERSRGEYVAPCNRNAVPCQPYQYPHGCSWRSSHLPHRTTVCFTHSVRTRGSPHTNLVKQSVWHDPARPLHQSPRAVRPHICETHGGSLFLDAGHLTQSIVYI